MNGRPSELAHPCVELTPVLAEGLNADSTLCGIEPDPRQQ
jgi:hypothetical protein